MSELSKADLLEKKATIDAELGRSKAELASIKRTAASKGKFIPVEQLCELEVKCKSLARRSQAIQTELAKMRAANQAAYREKRQSDSEKFMRAAKIILDENLFYEIMDEAGIFENTESVF